MADGTERGSILTYETSPNESLSDGVVAAVAAASGADPSPDGSADRPADGEASAALDPLYAAVDPEALDAVFRPGGSGGEQAGRVAFRYYGYRVTVSEAGMVRVADGSEERPGRVATDD